jgi:hypothetical protein
VDDVRAREAREARRPADRLVREGGPVLVVRVIEHGAARDDDARVLVEQVRAPVALIADDARPVRDPERHGGGLADARRQRAYKELGRPDNREQGREDKA